MKSHKGQILVVDPCLERPENGAYNLLSRFVAELSQSSQFSLSCLQFLLPKMSGVRIREALGDLNVAGIISLGSMANVTDNLPWVKNLGEDLRELALIDGIPFLGICFSHQLLAHITGGSVGYLRNREQISHGCLNGFRRSQVLHAKLGLLFADLENSDYYSGSAIDSAFRQAVIATRNWTRDDWRRLHDPEAHASAPRVDRLLIKLVQQYSPQSYTMAVIHEQEVLENLSSDLAVAATSVDCQIDALVHHERPVYSVQGHPETWHVAGDGWRLLKNFIYMVSILHEGLP